MAVARIRKPVVAGYYYPADRALLEEALDALCRGRRAPPQRARAVVAPHGSLRHSGAAAAAAFGAVEIPRRVMLIGPSHTGSWMPWSIMTRGAYRTPLGEVPIDSRGAEALRARCPFLTDDAWAQQGEHAIEAVLPFLQRLGPQNLSIVPIIAGATDHDEYARLGTALAQVARLLEEPVLLVASTDLSHHEPAVRGAVQDRVLLDALCALDADALRSCVRERSIIMCGDGPAAAVLNAARALGATQASVAAYRTSVDGGGDPGSATGYAGIIIH
jgi:AmmeMemoRadiSam system protein B